MLSQFVHIIITVMHKFLFIRVTRFIVFQKYKFHFDITAFLRHL